MSNPQQIDVGEVTELDGEPDQITTEQYEQGQLVEWTQYVARYPIDYYGARAYNIGDPVPASAVGDDQDAGRWVPLNLVTEVEQPTEQPTPRPAATAASTPAPVAAPPAADTVPTPEV